MPESKMYALGEVKSVEDDENPNGGFDVVLSSPSLDRDGEIIDAKVFDPLPEHITFDIDHGMSTATTVGSGKPFYEGDVLRVKGTFSSIPRAQEVRTLVREGHIKTTSVAFMGAEREEKDGVTHITKAELLNGAFVAIPSNRDALVLSAKSYDEKVAAPPLCANCAEPTDVPPAPVAPAESAGKSPASNVVAAARLRARHALDGIAD
jgi:phage head maturation protease